MTSRESSPIKIRNRDICGLGVPASDSGSVNAANCSITVCCAYFCNDATFASRETAQCEHGLPVDRKVHGGEASYPIDHAIRIASCVGRAHGTAIHIRCNHSSALLLSHPDLHLQNPVRTWIRHRTETRGDRMAG
jgi:hypothetical protein